MSAFGVRNSSCNGSGCGSQSAHLAVISTSYYFSRRLKCHPTVVSTKLRADSRIAAAPASCSPSNRQIPTCRPGRCHAFDANDDSRRTDQDEMIFEAPENPGTRPTDQDEALTSGREAAPVSVSRIEVPFPENSPANGAASEVPGPTSRAAAAADTLSAGPGNLVKAETDFLLVGAAALNLLLHFHSS